MTGKGYKYAHCSLWGPLMGLDMFGLSIVDFSFDTPLCLAICIIFL